MKEELPDYADNLHHTNYHWQGFFKANIFNVGNFALYFKGFFASSVTTLSKKMDTAKIDMIILVINFILVQIVPFNETKSSPSFNRL